MFCVLLGVVREDTGHLCVSTWTRALFIYIFLNFFQSQTGVTSVSDWTVDQGHSQLIYITILRYCLHSLSSLNCLPEYLKWMSLIQTSNKRFAILLESSIRIVMSLNGYEEPFCPYITNTLYVMTTEWFSHQVLPKYTYYRNGDSIQWYQAILNAINWLFNYRSCFWFWNDTLKIRKWQEGEKHSDWQKGKKKIQNSGYKFRMKYHCGTFITRIHPVHICCK